MIAEEVKDRFEEWYERHADLRLPDPLSIRSQELKEACRAAFYYSHLATLDPVGRPVIEQMGVALLVGRDDVLFEAVDRLVDEGLLPTYLSVSCTIKDMPLPGDHYDTKRGPITVTGLHTSDYCSTRTYCVYYTMDSDGQPKQHRKMTVSRFLSWAKRVPKEEKVCDRR